MNPRPALIVAAAAGVLALYACDEATTGNSISALGVETKVVTATANIQSLVDEIEALGTAHANESINIQARISSVVERIAFEEGQLVSAGVLLVELENSEIVAGLALAQASLAESRSLYERNNALSSSKAVSASNLEQLLAQVRVDEAQVEAARARLANTQIRAPFKGRIGLRRISPGGYVDSSTVITTLDDVSTIKLDFSVPETFLTVVSKGMKIIARSIVYPDRVFEGIVSSVDTRLDPVSRAVQVRAEIPNADSAIKPGMFMTVDLQREQGDVLLVPEQSIVPEGSAQYVFVVADGVAKKRNVVLGRRIPGFVVIRNGLSAGESVVTEGTGKVRDGSPVQSLDQASATTQRPSVEG